MTERQRERLDALPYGEISTDEALDALEAEVARQRQAEPGWRLTSNYEMAAPWGDLKWKAGGWLMGRSGDRDRSKASRAKMTERQRERLDALPYGGAASVKYKPDEEREAGQGEEGTDEEEDDYAYVAERQPRAAADTSPGRASASGGGAAARKPRAPIERWSEAEDASIRAGVAAHGPKWKQIADVLPGRSDDAVRNRWKRLSQREVAKVVRGLVAQVAREVRAEAQVAAVLDSVIARVSRAADARERLERALPGGGGGVGVESGRLCMAREHVQRKEEARRATQEPTTVSKAAPAGSEATALQSNAVKRATADSEPGDPDGLFLARAMAMNAEEERLSVVCQAALSALYPQRTLQRAEEARTSEVAAQAARRGAAKQMRAEKRPRQEQQQRDKSGGIPSARRHPGSGAPHRSVFCDNRWLKNRARMAEGVVLSTDAACSAACGELAADLEQTNRILTLLPRLESTLDSLGENPPSAVWLRGETTSGSAMACYYLTPLAQLKTNPAQGGAKGLGEAALDALLHSVGVPVRMSSLLRTLDLPPTVAGAVMLYAGEGAPVTLKPFSKSNIAWQQWWAQGGIPRADQAWLRMPGINQPLRKRPKVSGAGKGLHHDAFVQAASGRLASTTTVKLGSVHSFPCEFVLDKDVAPYVLPEGDQRKQLVSPTTPDQNLLISHFGQDVNIPFKHQVRDRSGGMHESITLVSFASGSADSQVLLARGWTPSVAEMGGAIVERPLSAMWGDSSDEEEEEEDDSDSFEDENEQGYAYLAHDSDDEETQTALSPSLDSTASPMASPSAASPTPLSAFSPSLGSSTALSPSLDSTASPMASPSAASPTPLSALDSTTLPPLDSTTAPMTPSASLPPLHSTVAPIAPSAALPKLVSTTSPVASTASSALLSVTPSSVASASPASTASPTATLSATSFVA